MFDGEAFGEEIVTAVKAYVDRATAPLLKRIEELEGERLTSADLIRQVEDTARAAAQSAAEHAISLIPPVVAVDTEALLATLKEAAEGLVGEALAGLPSPKDGNDGKDVDPNVVREMVAEAVAALPAAKAGEPGKDGIGLADALIDSEGRLVVTTTAGATKTLGRVVGADGEPGKRGDPGRDGLTLADFDTELSEDGRILTLSLENDDMKVTHELQLPVMIYRGVYKDGGTYLQGDTVTWAGSLWHCEAETADKPGDGCAAWKLAVRKGRDAKGAV